ncbi:MAG: alcohol dehydrogenase [Planctomycetaceae bacterium]|nr:alcohol dehydrogenase [Planctomycetaceae bacterium]
MKAAVLHEIGGPFSVEEIELLPPEPGEVRVRLAAAGICHSDWHFVTGSLPRPLPLVLGHEGAGIVDAVGAGVTSVEPGQRVILNWAPACGSCFYCAQSLPVHCETFWPWRNGTMPDGSTRLRLNGEPVRQFSTHSTFAEQAVAPEQALVPIADDIPFEVAALIGCAVTTGVGAAVNTVNIRPGESVAVFGCGGVGLNILQGARMSAAHPIIAVDTDPAKMEIARQFGATHAIASGEETRDQIRALTGGRGVAYAFEAIGLPAVQEAAFKAIRRGGALVVVGVAPVGSKTSFSGLDLHTSEKRILGSLFGSTDPRREFPRLLDLYRSGQLMLDELISARYPLEQINEAYTELLDGGFKRGVILFDEAAA